MSLTIFRNRRAEFAEALLEHTDHQFRQQLEQLKTEHWAVINKLCVAHDAHRASIEALHVSMEYEAMRERADLKKAHAEELNRVIDENQKLKDDMDRLRLLLTPALQSVELPKERTATPSPKEETLTGTPWQRVLKRETAMQTENPKLRRAMEAAAKTAADKGESHGSSSEGRNDASLGGESKPA